MKRLTLILKPTVLCNCSCRYCITPTNIPKSKMDIELFEDFCKKLSKSSIYDYFLFIWHGGEPLLLGVPFYEKVIQIQNRYFKGKTAINTFQSNCTLIDPEWMNFLKRYKIRVSTSLDGDKELHDANRIKNGKGTFDETIERIKWLQQEKLLAGVVTVLSKNNINHVDRFLKFFSENNISTRLNPILPSERVVSMEEDLSITPEQYAECLIHCYDQWTNGEYKYNDRNIGIAPLNEIIYNMFNEKRPRLCNFSGNCADSFLSINPIGDLYNCGRFCDIEEFKIANVRDDFESIDDIFEKKRSLIKWDSESSDCNKCEWKSICNRGCPNTSYLIDGAINEKDPYCSAYKQLFNYIYNHLKASLPANE